MPGLNLTIPVNGRGLYIGSDRVKVTVPAVDMLDRTATLVVTVRMSTEDAVCIDLPNVDRLITVSVNRVRTSSQVELNIDAPREIPIGDVS
jgi:hypothetical protein